MIPISTPILTWGAQGQRHPERSCLFHTGLDVSPAHPLKCHPRPLPQPPLAHLPVAGINP